MLFPTAQETPRELANEVSRAAAAMASTTTLLVSHKRVHRKATQSACPVSSRAVAHASCSIARAVWT
jgi:DeoR/GlpR family transcriptional regulator of sugar metabolism